MYVCSYRGGVCVQKVHGTHQDLAGVCTAENKGYRKATERLPSNKPRSTYSGFYQQHSDFFETIASGLWLLCTTFLPGNFGLPKHYRRGDHIVGTLALVFQRLGFANPPIKRVRFQHFPLQRLMLLQISWLLPLSNAFEFDRSHYVGSNIQRGWRNRYKRLYGSRRSQM